MTVALAIITAALRESNIIPVGQVPSVNHQNEGFDRLNALIASAYAAHQLKDWPVGTGEYLDPQYWTSYDWMRVSEDSRIVYNMAQPTTLYLPANPQEGARVGLIDIGNNAAANPVTLMGNGRTIEGAKTLVITESGVNRVWVYRADLGDWKRITALADLTTDVPFPPEFDDYFITKLGMRLNPRYGRALAQESLATLQEQENAFVARYNNRRRAVPADKGALMMNQYRPGRAEDPYNPSIDA